MKCLSTRALTVVAVVVMLLGTTACGSDGSRATVPPTADASLRGAITVSAASSLSGAFDTLSRQFARRHPGTAVNVNAGSSAALVTQIEQGAPADVFASADTTNMAQLVDAKRTRGTPTVIAHNRLAIVTKPGNPQRIATLADLTHGGVVALCAGTVPCGKYATQILTAAGLSIPETAVTREADAQATIGAVANGDADAAIVYLTDARAAGTAVNTVTIPAGENVIATYPMAVLRPNSAQKLAQAFVAYVRSSMGQRVLREFGFLPA